MHGEVLQQHNFRTGTQKRNRGISGKDISVPAVQEEKTDTLHETVPASQQTL